MATVCWLALKDLLHDWRFSACTVLALVAVVAPALVLFGLRTGYLEGERREILQDPRALAMRTSFEDLSASYSREWFAEMERRPDVRFITPDVDLLGAQVELRNQADTPGSAAMVLPSGHGDPVLRDVAGLPREMSEMVISATAARALGVGVGDQAWLFVSRTPDLTERFGPGGLRRLRVAGIVPEYREPRQVAYVTLPLVEAVHDYRAGYGVPELDWPGAPDRPVRDSYEGFRLYARGLDDVLPLRDELERRGYHIATNAERIEDLQRAQEAFDLVGTVVGTLAGITVFLCLSASLWAGVERKRRALGAMAMLGITRGRRVLFPMVQSLLVAALACVVSGLGFAAGAAAFDRAATGSRALLHCVLYPGQLATFGAVITVTALAAAAVAASQTARIEPVEGLRDA